jgi:hypothetical protein
VLADGFLEFFHNLACLVAIELLFHTAQRSLGRLPLCRLSVQTKPVTQAERMRLLRFFYEGHFFWSPQPAKTFRQNRVL